MPVSPEDLVRREVFYCVSSLVSTLAGGQHLSYQSKGDKALSDLVEQATELAMPIDDWEEAAIQEGWATYQFGAEVVIRKGDLEYSGGQPDDWQNCCEGEGIEPYQREIFEHWIVSDWLADKLAAKGEKVDKDFAGLTVWGRTTTGQGIASDSVIISITEEMNK